MIQIKTVCQQKKVLLAILTKNNPHFLHRLLNSIYQHPELRQCPILIVDDSRDPHLIQENNLMVKKFDLSPVIVNRYDWDKIKRSIVLDNSSLDFASKLLMQRLTLGIPRFNTFNARNITSIVVKLYFSKYNYVFCLDNDIIFPQNFILRNPKDAHLIGVKVTGSPDLSRFEWIRLYLLYLKKKYGMSIKDKRAFYVKVLIQSLSLSHIQYLIHTYTDLYANSSNIMRFLITYPIPVREFNTGSFFTSSKLLLKSMFPPYYGEDFLWLNFVRRSRIRQYFFSKPIIHAAERKHISDAQKILFEEEGHLLNLITKSKYIESSIKNGAAQKAFFWKNKINQDLLLLAYKLRKITTEAKEMQQLEVLIEVLTKLINFVEKSNISDFTKKINEIKENNLIWRRLLSNLQQMNLDSFIK